MTHEPVVEFVYGLPARPTLLWSEERTSWGLFALASATVSGGNTERRYAVEVSVNGLTVRQPVDGGFFSWERIRAVVPASLPDLAVLELSDGTTITVDAGHLPHDDASRQIARRQRLALLDAAFRASRAMP